MGIFERLKQSLFGLSPWSKAAKKDKPKKKNPVKKGWKKAGTKPKPKSKPTKTRPRKKEVKKSPIKPIQKRTVHAVKPTKTKGAVSGKIKTPEIKEVFLGEVTHYFPRVNAAAMVMEAGELKIGERVRIRGDTTDFIQTVKSLQINRQPIPVAKKGDEIGLEVKAEVRTHDKVYRII